MQNTNYSLSDIHVYQDAVSLTETIFSLSTNKALDPVFSDQLRKTSVDLCTQIVQGFRSRRKVVFADFLYDALGSGNKIYALLDIAQKVGADPASLSELQEQAVVINKKMYAFRKRLLETKEEKEKNKAKGKRDTAVVSDK